MHGIIFFNMKPPKKISFWSYIRAKKKSFLIGIGTYIMFNLNNEKRYSRLKHSPLCVATQLMKYILSYCFIKNSLGQSFTQKKCIFALFFWRHQDIKRSILVWGEIKLILTLSNARIVLPSLFLSPLLLGSL